MKTRNLKLLATLTIVVIALGLAVVGLVVLISHEEDPNPTSILTMTVDQVLVAANAGQLDTFDKIMAARTAIDKNRPPTPAVLTEDRTTIETAIAEYHDAEERYGTESIEAFAEAMVGTEVRDWVGWVVFVEGGKADGGATIGVYMTDPYATQRAPRPRPWVIYTDPTMPDVYIGATEEDARIVVAGDLI